MDDPSGDPFDELQDYPPGENPNEPYEGIDTETLPEWWRNAVEEFERADLRTFRPSRFRDGVLVEPLLSRLRATHELSIVLIGSDVEYGDHWALVINGTTVAEFEHDRLLDGYSVYDIGSDRVIELVETYLEKQ